MDLEIDTRDILEKAYEKLLPAAGYMVSSTAGFAASVVVFTTWLLRKTRSARERTRAALEYDQTRLVGLKQRIEALQGDLERLRALRSRANGEWEERRIERSIKALERDLERLMEEYELVELRITAVRKLREIGAGKALEDAYRLAEKIEEGRIGEAEYRVLKMLEEEWRRRASTLQALRRMVEEA